MNGNQEFVDLLKSHYIMDENASKGLQDPEQHVYRRINLSSICSREILREEAKQKR